LEFGRVLVRSEGAAVEPESEILRGTLDPRTSSVLSTIRSRVPRKISLLGSTAAPLAIPEEYGERPFRCQEECGSFVAGNCKVDDRRRVLKRALNDRHIGKDWWA